MDQRLFFSIVLVSLPTFSSLTSFAVFVNTALYTPSLLKPPTVNVTTVSVASKEISLIDAPS